MDEMTQSKGVIVQARGSMCIVNQTVVQGCRPGTVSEGRNSSTDVNKNERLERERVGLNGIE